MPADHIENSFSLDGVETSYSVVSRRDVQYSLRALRIRCQDNIRIFIVQVLRGIFRKKIRNLCSSYTIAHGKQRVRTRTA